MLTLVEVRSALGALLSLPLDDASSGIFIKDFAGLDPVNATLVSSSFAGADGEQYHTMRREARDVQLKLGLEPDYSVTTVRALRAQLYTYFMSGMPVNLRFYLSDGLTVEIDGRVSACEAPQFSNEPEMTVTIRCFNPDFRELTTTTYSANTVADSTDGTIVYNGTVDTGLVFSMTLNRAITDFTIYHTPPDGTLRTLYFNSALASGDKLDISTVRGSKYVTKTTAGSSSSLLKGMSPQSNWIRLQPGQNKLRVYTTGAAIPYSLTWTNKHGGL